MSELLTGAQLVTSTTYEQRSRAEIHALSFLMRFRIEHTRKSYEIALRQWFEFCRRDGIDPLEATRTHIELFARELELTGRKVSTVGGKLNALAGFYRFAKIDGLIDRNPMDDVARPKIQRTSTTLGLTRTEFADVIEAAQQYPSRDQSVIYLLGINGMRVSEVCGIDIEDLDRHQGQRIVRILRKGGKYQHVPLVGRVAWQVEETVGTRTSGPLFLDHTGTKRLDRRAAGRIVSRVVRAAGITKRITPHSLRHTFVTMSLDAGRSERDIAASVGHADSRLVAYYDRGRDSIYRNTSLSVLAFVEGALLMAGPRPLSDPRPIVYMGAVPSFLFGFVTVGLVMAAGVAIARRWMA